MPSQTGAAAGSDIESQREPVVLFRQDAPDDDLACPRCQGRLEPESGAVHCAACESRYAIEDGVICTQRTQVFMGEFTAERMMDFVRAARERGWRKTVQDSMAAEDPGTRRILLSPSRASFLHLLDPVRRDSVLDLGAGMGAVSLQLAKSFDRVYAVDQTFERLAFLRVVADQEGAASIRTVCHRDVFRLPFRSGALCAAVMVGVFEYFPASYPRMPLGEVQRRALGELYRILQPGGVLFIATKNRFGWPNWAGALDNSGLRFGALLPRWLANPVSLALLGRPFRIVTDSYRRYSAMLREAGFRDARFYWPDGGYQSANAWIDLDDRDALRERIRALPATGLKRAVFSVLASTGARHAVPNFGIVVRKPG